MGERPVQRALIVGGGPGGMTAAIALAEQGVRCEIVERSSDWRPAGVGLGIHSAPLRALRSLDLMAPLVARAWPNLVIDMMRADGTPVGTIPQANVGGADDPPFITLSRMTLHEVLAERLDTLAVTVKTGTTVTLLQEQDDRVSVTLSDGTASEWDLVVGADGLHSQLREQLFPGGPAPELAGQVIWRLGAARPVALERYTIMIAGPHRMGLVPLSDDSVYLWMLDSTLPPERPPRDQILGLFQERMSAYGFVAGEIAEQVIEPDQLDYRALHWLIQPLPWHRGRIVLLGDAVHSTTPHMAYGVGLAFEDAVVLGELVGSGLSGEELGTAYGRRRFERARLVVENCVQLSKWEEDPAIPPQQSGQLIGQTFGVLAGPI